MKKIYGDYRGYGQLATIPPNFLSPGSKDRKNGEDLNQILGNILQEMNCDDKPFVIRCDELPRVRGSEEKLWNIFHYIINFIVSRSPQELTLFLYIKCEAVRADTIDLSLGSNEKKYKVSFHTNSDAKAIDFPEDQKKYCSDGIAEMKGNFSVNTEPGTGWLFNLEVPGKLK